MLMYLKTSIAQYFLFFLLFDYENCLFTSELSPDLQFKQMELNIQDEDFQGNQNINYGIQYGLWSKYAPLSSILQVGNVGIFDSNCFHYHNAADKVTSRINMIYYDCLDYEKRTITKRVEFIDDQNKLHLFQIDIKSDEYENEWFVFLFMSLPQLKKFKILLMSQKSQIIYEELSIQYPFLDKKLIITFGGGIQANYNNIIKFSYFPGKLYMYWFSNEIQHKFLDPEISLYLQAKSDFPYMIKCQINENPSVFESLTFSRGDKIIYNSQYSNDDYFQLNGWIRIQEMTSTKSDLVHKIIKVSANSQNSRLMNDDLSPFQLLYKISPTQKSIIFNTYSYTFPTINLDALNETFLITFEFKINNNLENWHFLSVTLIQKVLIVKIEFYDGILSKVYSKSIPVQQFNMVSFHLQFGNLLDNMNNYLNIEMRMFYFYNCNQNLLKKCFDEDCHTCIGPESGDCQNCLQNTKKIYLPETKQCVCSLDTVDQEICLSIQDVGLLIVEQSEVMDTQCAYGYFSIDSECFPCPSIISESSITCLECLNNPSTWYTMMYCSSQLVSYNGEPYTQETFDKMYYIFNGVEVNYCNDCTSICILDCLNTHFEIVSKTNGVKCSFQSIYQEQDCFQCNILNCLICSFSISQAKYCVVCIEQYIVKNGQCVLPPQPGEPEFCFNNCAFCKRKICQICNPPYYLTHDRSQCKLCTIQNCKYCFEYNTNDRTKNTIFKQFASFETDQFIKVGCSLCNDDYNYNFNLNQCVKGIPQITNCLRSYIELSGEEKCLLSAVNDFNIAPQIINCQNYIQNCEQCIITISKTYKCIICKAGYGSSLFTGLCDICSIKNSKVCIQQDYQLKDYWVQLIQSFIIQFFSHTYYYPQPSKFLQADYPLSCLDGYYPSRAGFCREYCDQKCLQCSQTPIYDDFQCKQCPKSLYGNSNLSNDGKNCLECSKFCLSCRIRTEVEIKKINPYFVVTNTNRIFTNTCLRALQDYRIRIDSQTQIAYYCLDENCSRSLEKQIQINSLKLQYSLEDVDFGNQWAITNFTITFFVIYSEIDYFSTIKANFSNTLKDNIFTLQTSIIQFIRLEEHILQGNMHIVNFDMIFFKDITYLITETNDKLDFENYDGSIDLHMKNTYFSGWPHEEVSFSISAPLYRDLILNNITISNLNFRNIVWLEYISNFDEKQIMINQLRIQNCTFDNITLFSFLQFSKSISFQNIEILDSNFSQSTFLQINFTKASAANSLIHYINSITVRNCRFNFSFLIQNVGDQKLQIRELGLYDNTFYSTIIIQTKQQATLRIVQIEKNLFESSIFFKSTNQIDLGFLIEYSFHQFQIKQNIFRESSIIQILQQNDIQIHIQAENFVQDDLLENQINSENQITNLPFYDFKCNILNIQNFTFHNTYIYAYFKIYQTHKIIITNVLFSNVKQQYKISSSAPCNLPIAHSPMLISVQGFIEIDLIKISFVNQFSIDVSLIEIQSDFQLQSTGVDIIRLEEISFVGNIVIKYNLANLFSLLVIYSERKQNIYLKNVTFQENFFHQLVDDPSQVGAGLLYLYSFQSFVEVDGFTCLCNSMTNSSYPFMALNFLTININQFYVNNHNFQSLEIWQKYYQIQLNTTYSSEMIHSIIDQFFGIKTIGGIIKIICSQLKLQNSYFSNILAQSSVGLAIATQGQGLIQIENFKILSASAILSQNSSIDGCITISSVTSLLNLLLKNINFDKVQNRFGSAILTIYPSLKQNKISLINININNSFSLMDQFMKVQFSIASAEQNQVFIRNLNIMQNQVDFNQYLQRINFPSIIEMHKWNNENAMIKLQDCSLIIDNFQVTGILISPLFIVNDAKRIIIKNLKIQQVVIVYPFRILSFTFTETKSQEILLEDVIFIESTLFLQTNVSNQKLIYSFSQQMSECQLNTEILKTEEVSQTISEFIQIINSTSDQQGSFIFIGGITQLSKVYLNRINMRNNNCSYCYDGLIHIEQLISSKVVIQQLLCTSNIIQQYGCLFLTTDLQSEQSQLQYSVIQFSKFIFNLGQMGVGIFIQNTPFKILNNVFLNNNASLKGGAIFVTDIETKFLFNNTFIIGNRANFGGGINLQGSNFLQTDNFVQSLLILNNANQLSNNLVENPDHLIFQINNQDLDFRIQKRLEGDVYFLNLTPYQVLQQGKLIQTNHLYFPSKQKLSNYKIFNDKTQSFQSYITQFSITYMNSLNEILKGEEKDYCQLFQRKFSESKQQGLENYNLIQNFSFLVAKNQIDLTSIIIEFDPYQDKDYVIQLLFSCQTRNVMKKLNYLINAKTLKCQLGEFYTNNGCQQCEPNYGFYSVEYDVVKCSIFDVNKLENITQNQLKLREGYWRPNYFSNEIEQCFKGLKYCTGGWKVNNDICLHGHIGGLCEECDSFNMRGYGNFVKINMTTCGNCSSDSTLLPFFAILLWSLISIMFTLRSIRLTNKIFLTLKSTTKLFSILFRLQQNFESIFLKMLLNYLWLFSVIFAFNMSFNFSIWAIDSISSPNVSIATNLDCQLIKFEPIQLIYLRIITMGILLLIQILIILIGFKGYFYLEEKDFDYSVISNLLIYLYVSNQAQLIKSFGSLVAVRTISGIDYIQGDVSLHFYSENHIIWIYAIILPFLILTGLLIPLFFFTILISNKNKFISRNFRKHLGYLFNEYNEECSYWEQIKILQRSVIIIIITYFETDIQIKASLMSLTLIAYSLLAQNRKPYIIKSLNTLDFESCCIIQISIFIAIVEYISQQKNQMLQSTILQIFMLLLFLRLFYSFISKIIYLYYKKYQTKILFHLKNLAQKLFRNSTVHTFLNQKYEQQKLKKEKLDFHFEKIREWRNLQSKHQKQATLTGFFNLTMTKDRNQTIKSLAAIRLMR